MNRILQTLPAKEFRQISLELKPVRLAQGDMLYEAGQLATPLFFPDDAVISYLGSTAEGQTLGLCVIGNDGIVGVGSIARAAELQAVVQLPGSAYVMERDS